MFEEIWAELQVELDVIRERVSKLEQQPDRLPSLWATNFAALPAPSNGYLIAFVTDARKIGESKGNGTGTLAFYDGTDWLRAADESVLDI